jgi:hypothetical protein
MYPALSAGLREALQCLATQYNVFCNPLQQLLAAGSLSPDSLTGEWTAQKWWSAQVSGSVASAWAAASTARLQALRLYALRSYHDEFSLIRDGSLGVGTTFSSPQWRLYFRLRLGMPLSQGGCVCPGCSADLDELGDHALSCKRLGVYSRHNAIRNVLASLFLDAGFRTELEQPKHASDRLADVLVHGFDGDTPLAIDVCVSHVLQSSMPLAAVQTGSVACLAEYRKSQESLAICKARGWNFAPFIGETLGGWGPVARQLVSRLAKFVSLKTGTPYAETAASVWSTLTSAMVYAVSRQLERAYGDVSAPPDNQPVPSGNPGSSSLNSCPMQIQSFPGDFVTSTPDTTNLSTAPAPPAAPLQIVPTPLPADGAANGQSMLNDVDVSEMSTDSPASDPSPPPAHPRAQSLPLGVADALDDVIM